MARDRSSDIEDTGRKDSEKRLKNKPKSKYLDDVLKQASQNHENVVKMIENENNKTSPFLKDLEAIIIEDTETESREQNIEALLKSTQSLLNLTAQARSAIAAGGRSRANDEKTRHQDRERVKEILGAGRRVCEGELKRVDGDEAGAQALAWFGEGVAGADAEAETSRALERMGKGVRKMVKGME